MARGRRKKTTKRRKYKSAINIKNAALSYLTLNAATQTLFNANPQQFFLGGFLGSNFFGSAGGGSSARVTLKELMAGMTLSGGAPPYTTHGPVMPQIEKNIRDNLGKGVMQIIGLQVANKLITKLKISSSFNRTVRSVGMGDLVKM
jgi:hypothetical protein